MPSQIVLSWAVDTTNTPFGALQAATALGAVPLYVDPATDPVLGQLFGLSVASDGTVQSGAFEVTRTLTLNMILSNAALSAPPSFPCHPRTATPPVLPYPLRRSVTLPGSFFPQNGSMVVATEETQVPSLSIGDEVQFLAQPGVFYTVAAVSATTVGISAPYTGVTGSTGAFKEVDAPATRVALYSTSDLDTNGVATDPVIPTGPGARTVTVSYLDSAGNAGAATVALTGRRPAAITLAPGTIDIAEIVFMTLATVGAFGNSLGQITLVELSDALPPIPSGTPVGTGIGATQSQTTNPMLVRTFKSLTDEAQLLIDRHLVYMPPSYFALAQQGAAAPSLAGEFFVTTGSKGVPTSEDQTGALVAGNVIEFAEQPGTRYTIAQVTARIVTLTTEYTGIDTYHAGLPGNPDINAGTQGNLGTAVINRRTDARLVEPLPAASPTNAELAALLAEYSETGTAAPDGSFPTPTFLSDLFTRQIRLALAGATVTPKTITFV